MQMCLLGHRVVGFYEGEVVLRIRGAETGRLGLGTAGRKVVVIGIGTVLGDVEDRGCGWRRRRRNVVGLTEVAGDQPEIGGCFRALDRLEKRKEPFRIHP